MWIFGILLCLFVKRNFGGTCAFGKILGQRGTWSKKGWERLLQTFDSYLLQSSLLTLPLWCKAESQTVAWRTYCECRNEKQKATHTASSEAPISLLAWKTASANISLENVQKQTGISCENCSNRLLEYVPHREILALILPLDLQT